jgi:dTDP-4-dehydrorhamnose reductase
MRSVAVIGPHGQLGTDLVKGFRSAGWAVTAVGHDTVAVEDRDSVEAFLGANPVDVVVNTAAFHQVAACEKDIARTWAVNAGGPRNVAVAARRTGAVAVFISTDYVFNGEIDATHSYPEDAGVSPVNVYGASKAGGEAATCAASERNLVVRIASVFGAAGSSGKGGNFVETIVSKARAGEALTVVDDVWMSPSYTVDVAAKIRGLLDLGANGIFHGCNDGRITWHEFATEICEQIGADVGVERSHTDATALPRRPQNSSLSTARLASLGISQRSWREALSAYLRERNHIT